MIDTPIGRAGIACCYDLRFPELFRIQQEKKIEVIILPASFTEQTGKVHWETLVKARAIENLSYVVTSCQGGYHINGKKTYGHTMIVSPWGKTLETLEKGKGFVSSEIDLIQFSICKRVLKEHDALQTPNLKKVFHKIQQHIFHFLIFDIYGLSF